MNIELFRKIVFGLVFSIFVFDPFFSKANCMNCTECLETCEKAAVSSNSAQIVGVSELGASFISNVVRTACEYSPAVVGAREVYKPLTEWLDARPIRILSNLFLVFPAVGMFYPQYEFLFNCVGAIPTFASGALTIGDVAFVAAAKCGFYKRVWKEDARLRLVNSLQNDSVDWIDSLPDSRWE